MSSSTILFNDSTSSARWSEAKARSVVEDRQRGLYTTDDTRHEAVVAWKDLASSDLGVFIHMSYGLFNKFNKAELKNMVKEWKKKRCFSEAYNVKELELYDGTKVWCFVIQHNKAQGICPLGLSHGLMVSGFCYFCKDKADCDFVVSKLSKGK